MNDTNKIIQDHRSIRNFTNKEIDDEIINEILKSSQAMPNSINGQQTSVIVIKNKNTKEKFAELTGGQTWIAQAPVFLVFIADFYKTNLGAQKNELTQIIHESLEGTLVGAIDVGLNLGAAIIAAESLGLGIVPIGGIRNNPEQVIKLLDLPEYTFPMVGLAVGYPADKSHKKPRLPLETFRHDETYHKEDLVKHIDEYDKMFEKYLIEIGREQEGNWSKNTANIYQHVYFPNVYPVAKQQGFKNNK